MSYSERSKFCGNILTAQLLSIMDRKKTNLAVSADLTSAAQITEVREGMMEPPGLFRWPLLWGREK